MKVFSASKNFALLLVVLFLGGCSTFSALNQNESISRNLADYDIFENYKFSNQKSLLRNARSEASKDDLAVLAIYYEMVSDQEFDEPSSGLKRRALHGSYIPKEFCLFSNSAEIKDSFIYQDIWTKELSKVLGEYDQWVLPLSLQI